MGLATCAVMLIALWVAAASQFGPPPDLNLAPTRAHVWVALADASGRARSPDVRFYAAKDLSGAPIMHLGARGLVIRGELVCQWAGGDFHNQLFSPIPMIRASAPIGDTKESCPTDLPISSVTERGLFIELARLDGFLAEVRYQGRTYYFDLRSVRYSNMDPRSQVLLPATSTPLLGVVDIPQIFRPRSVNKKTPIVLRAAPQGDSSSVANVSSLNDLEILGLENGTYTGAVYARTNRWSLLRLRDGRKGWLAPEDSGKYASLERILSVNSETYIHTNWDRTLLRSPGSGERFVVPSDPRREWIGYLEPISRVVRIEIPPGSDDYARLRRVEAILREHHGAQEAWELRPDGSAALDVQSGKAVLLFAQPDRASTPFLQFDSPSPASTLQTIGIPLSESRSSSGERVIVFSRRPGWFEVGLDEGHPRENGKRVWIEDSATTWTFHGVQDRVEADRLLSNAWGPEQPPAVAIKRMTRVNGALWLRVEVLIGSACERALGDLTSTVLGEGWIAAHNVNGRPTVWFETYCD